MLLRFFQLSLLRTDVVVASRGLELVDALLGRTEGSAIDCMTLNRIAAAEGREHVLGGDLAPRVPTPEFQV